MELYIRSAAELRAALRLNAARAAPRELSRGERGALIGRLNRVLGSDLGRRAALAYLFGAPEQFQLSTRQLTAGQWWALWEWVGFSPGDEPGEWLTAPSFPQEAVLALDAALRQGKATPSAAVREAVRSLGAKLVDVERLGRAERALSDYPLFADDDPESPIIF